MKIKKIDISCFRCIKKATFEFKNIVAIVGENNSGKSAILRALNVFFNPGIEIKNFKSGSHQYSSNSIPKIDILFESIPHEAYPNQSLVGKPILISCTYSKSDKAMHYRYKDRNKFHEYKRKSFSKLKNEIQYVLVSAIRNHEQTVANDEGQEDTLLRKLLVEYLSKYTKKRDTLTPKVNDAISYLRKNALQKVSDELNGIYSLKHRFNFNINHPSPIDYKVLLGQLTLNATEGDKEFPLADFGSGVQSLANIALYSYLASLRKGKIILGIEEPETNLHPQAQKEFIEVVKNSIQNTGTQIFLTTHSTTIADQLKHEDILLCRKEFDKTRGFKSAVYQIPRDFSEIHDLATNKYYKFFQYKNSDFLFSKFVVVAESSVDAEVIKELLKQRKINLDIYGVSVLNLEGIQNLKYPYYLLKYLKIPYLLIVDKDFFLPYSDVEAEKSRSSSGFYKYKKEFADDKFIQDLVPSLADRTSLLKLLFENHSRAMVLLKKYSVLCFKFNLEMDLIASKVAQQNYFSLLKIDTQKQNTHTLLVDYKKRIKDLDMLAEVLKKMPHRNLPNSYKRIKRDLEKVVKSLNA